MNQHNLDTTNKAPEGMECFEQIEYLVRHLYKSKLSKDAMQLLLIGDATKVTELTKKCAAMKWKHARFNKVIIEFLKNQNSASILAPVKSPSPELQKIGANQPTKINKSSIEEKKEEENSSTNEERKEGQEIPPPKTVQTIALSTEPGPINPIFPQNALTQDPHLVQKLLCAYNRNPTFDWDDSSEP